MKIIKSAVAKAGKYRLEYILYKSGNALFLSLSQSKSNRFETEKVFIDFLDEDKAISLLEKLAQEKVMVQSLKDIAEDIKASKI